MGPSLCQLDILVVNSDVLDLQPSREDCSLAIGMRPEKERERESIERLKPPLQWARRLAKLHFLTPFRCTSD